MSKPKIDKNIQIPDEVLKELLTPSEARMLKNRWQIANLLEEGLTMRKIAERAKVGTDTVVRVAKMMKNRNLRSNEKPMFKKIKTSTPWIFGKPE